MTESHGVETSTPPREQTDDIRDQDSLSPDVEQFLDEHFPELREPLVVSSRRLTRARFWLSDHIPTRQRVRRVGARARNRLVRERLTAFLLIDGLAWDTRQNLIGSIYSEVEEAVTVSAHRATFNHYFGPVFGVALFTAFAIPGLILMYSPYSSIAFGYEAVDVVYFVLSLSRVTMLSLAPLSLIGGLRVRLGVFMTFCILGLWPTLVVIQFVMWGLKTPYDILFGGILGLSLPQSQPALLGLVEAMLVCILLTALVWLAVIWDALWDLQVRRWQKMKTPLALVLFHLLDALGRIEGHQPTRPSNEVWPRYRVRQQVAIDLELAATNIEHSLPETDFILPAITDTTIQERFRGIAQAVRALKVMVIFPGTNTTSVLTEKLCGFLTNLVMANWAELPVESPSVPLTGSATAYIWRVVKLMLIVGIFVSALLLLDLVPVTSGDSLFSAIQTLRLALLISVVLVTLGSLDSLFKGEYPILRNVTDSLVKWIPKAGG